ncbi:hypothetical protein [Frigoribacterium sp. Leaf263]|uniref:hypothetical protein n=1 Tax=Frigoribacterium sp. Leaf263 TaxID=1736313 RepID=UPI0012E14CEF|nr:hypothetical protein [Frigoribacterium sp. Leaf263]
MRVITPCSRIRLPSIVRRALDGGLDILGTFGINSSLSIDTAGAIAGGFTCGSSDETRAGKLGLDVPSTDPQDQFSL